MGTGIDVSDLITYIRNNNMHIRIEVEGNANNISNFINRHNQHYQRNVSMNTDGIRILHTGADKWGVQRRIYFHTIDRMPVIFQQMVKSNNSFDPTVYPYRINSKKVVEALFAQGFVIGNN
ncbi:MAG: hypothetical protein LKI18_00010 [Prevotella sp.]|jgi:hypothetical protein|nr:hypothetical protein [Prevotella sp.]